MRLLGDRKQISPELAACLDALAATEPAVEVRQQLACTAKRLPVQQGLPIISANVVRDIDNDDPLLPLLLWWAVEQHSVTGRDEVLRVFARPTVWSSHLARETLLPRLARRYAAERSQQGLNSLVMLLKAAPAGQHGALWSAVLRGWGGGAPGETPEQYAETVSTHEFSRMVREAWHTNPNDLCLLQLAIQLRLREPLELAMRRAFDHGNDVDQRVALLDIVAQTNDPSLVEPALRLIKTDASDKVCSAGLRILSRFEDPRITTTLMGLQQSSKSVLSSQSRNVLLSRSSSARVWLEAVDRGEIDAEAATLEEVRRVALLQNAELNALVVKHWGQLHSRTPEDKLAEVRRLNNDLRASAGDVSAGKLLFAKHCAVCHTLFGEGQKLGPDLTTANRQDRNFMLISLVDPDNMIRKEYISAIVQTFDGRVLTGLPVARDDAGMTLANANNERILVAESEIEELRESNISIMPSELYKQLNPQELRDLFAYLESDDGTD